MHNICLRDLCDNNSKCCTTFTTDVQNVAIYSDASTEALTPLLHCVVNDMLVEEFPLLRNVVQLLLLMLMLIFIIT